MMRVVPGGRAHDRAALPGVLDQQTAAGPSLPVEPGVARALTAALAVAATLPIRFLGTAGLGLGAAGGDPERCGAAMARA